MMKSTTVIPLGILLLFLLILAGGAVSLCPKGCECLSEEAAKKLGYSPCEGQKASCGYDQLKNPLYCYGKAVTTTVPVTTTPVPVQCPETCDCLTDAEAKSAGSPGYCGGKQTICGSAQTLAALIPKFCYEKPVTTAPPVTCPAGCDCISQATAKDKGYSSYCGNQQSLCGYDQYQNPLYCYTTPPAITATTVSTTLVAATTAVPEDRTPPTVSVSSSPAALNPSTVVTFDAAARDESGVSGIRILVNGGVVRECRPPDYSTQDTAWHCTATGGPYPAGTITMMAEATDPEGNTGISAERTAEITPLAIAARTTLAREAVSVPCSISGRLSGFRYRSTTVQVRVCEASTVGGCSSVPPFFCVDPTTVCTSGGNTWYGNVTRVWAGEERFLDPGPLDYRVTVPCTGTYLVQPVFLASGEECRWRGTWTAERGNTVSLSGTGQEGIDFSFRAEDTTAPGIEVRAGLPAPPAAHRGEGKWNLSVHAGDTAGIQAIRVTGELTLSPFASNTSGPLPVVNATRMMTVSRECTSSPCEVPVPYNPGGKSVSANLRIRACDQAGNSVETSYSRTFPDDPGDLSLNSVEPVQVLYGAPLVEGKGTAFRAKVSSSFPHPVETWFRLGLPAGQWGVVQNSANYLIGLPPEWRFPDLWGPITIPAGARDFEVMLPIISPSQRELNYTPEVYAARYVRGRDSFGTYGPDVRALPIPMANPASFSIEVDPQGAVPESNEGNNRMDSGATEVITMRRWAFYFVPFLNKDGNCAPDVELVSAGAKNQLEYLLANFPIADGKLSYAIAPITHPVRCAADPTRGCGWTAKWEPREGYYQYEDRGTFLRRIASLARSEGYDFGVAIGCGCGGGAGGSDAAVFIGDCSGGDSYVLAHEFSHVVTGMGDIYSLDCVVGWDEAYCEFANGTRNYCCYRDYSPRTLPYCQMVGNTPSCRGSFAENCVRSCDCSIYKNTDACKAAGATICDAGCCAGRCGGAGCPGGTVYNGPDGRIWHNASAGYWANRWLPVTTMMHYFMDSSWPSGGTYPYHWMRWENTVQHCEGVTFADGYRNLLANTRFRDPRDPEALLVRGTVTRDGTARFEPFLRLTEANLDLEAGSQGAYSIALLDGAGQVLLQAGFDLSFVMPDPRGGPIDESGFVYRIEWKPGTKTVELRDSSGKVLASRAVSSGSPSVKVISPNGGESWIMGDTYKVKWEGSDPDGDNLTYSLSVSLDQGKAWIPVDLDITATEYDLGTTGLTPSTTALVKVRATDGVNTGEDVSDAPFTIGEEQEKGGALGPDPSFTLLAAAAALLAAASLRGRRKRG
jgi:hypothetical protein